VASSLAKHNAAPQLWISRVDADARQLSKGDAIKIFNERGEFGAMANITEDVPPGVVWIRDGWVGLNHLTSGDAVLVGDAPTLFSFSVGRSDYGAQVEVVRSSFEPMADAADEGPGSIGVQPMTTIVAERDECGRPFSVAAV
jgi:anaerobic selenocysteine-containing dehydrogenase